jgi:hypothetical protein
MILFSNSLNNLLNQYTKLNETFTYQTKKKNRFIHK